MSVLGALVGMGRNIHDEKKWEEGRKDRERRAEIESLEIAGLKDKAKRRSQIDQLRSQMFDEPAGEDAAGNVQETRPRKFKDQSEYLSTVRQFGARAMELQAADMTPKQIMEFNDLVKKAETEGSIEAMNEFIRTGSPEAMVKAYNLKGDTEIVGIIPQHAKDGRRVFKARMRDRKTGEERWDELDPEMDAFMLGGLEGLKKRHEVLDRARARKVDEQRLALNAETEDRREREGIRRHDATLAAINQRRDAANLRAQASSRGGVFAAKYDGWVRALRSENPDLSDEEVHAMAMRQADRSRGEVQPADELRAAVSLLRDPNGRYRNIDQALDAVRKLPARPKPKVVPTSERPSLDAFKRR